MSRSLSQPRDDEARLNLLAAYPYLRGQSLLQLLRERAADVRFLIDSGAFTAWKSGKPIALDDYCRFLEALPFQPWRYFTLDVIGDARATLANYDEMVRRGFKPIPIFTRGTDPAILEHYYATSDVVGIGGLVGTEGNRGFVNGVMKIVKKRKVHLLGFTDLDFIKHYRPYTCDATGWTSFQHGSVRIYAGAGRILTLKKADFRQRPAEEVCRAIDSYGMDPQLLAKESSWQGLPVRHLSAQSAIRLAVDVQANLGTLMFAPVASRRDARWFFLGYDREKQRGTQ